MNRVAVVTGAARGIGQAIVRRLEEDGFAVAGLDRSAFPPEDAAPRSRWLPVRCDVRDGRQIERALAEVEARLGAPWALVNNAGYGGPFHRIDEVSDDEWREVIETNLYGTFATCRALLPGMRARGGGRVVNIASVLGLRGAARSSTYAASKHGVVGLTRSLALEWGPHGITCNAICPGHVDTAMGIPPGAGPSERARILDRIPTGRIGRPEEIAALVAWLLGPHAGYANGAVWTLDGGATAE